MWQQNEKYPFYVFRVFFVQLYGVEFVGWESGSAVSREHIGGGNSAVDCHDSWVEGHLFLVV